MAEPAVATIRRQLLEVDVRGSEADGAALQRRLPDLCARVLAPALESALGRVDPGDAVLYVERLEIDLTALSLERLETDLPAAVRGAVEAFFRSNLAPGPVRAGGVVPRPSADASASESPVRRRTHAQAAEDALVAFLLTGRLPWSFVLPPGSRLEDVILDTWVVAGSERRASSNARNRIRSLLADPRARTRLVLQFSPDFVMALLDEVSPDVATSVARTLSAAADAGAATPAVVAFSRGVWEHALAAAAEGRRVTPYQLVASALQGLPAADRADRALATAVARRWPDLVLPTADTVGIALPSVAGRGRTHPRVTRDAVTDGDDEGGLLVDNAGLVLLHPFLPSFFEALGIAAGDELLDPDRALCLLHHLATGQKRAPEHELTLAKVLCGVAEDVPVAADVGLTAAETDEATALLTAAIGHWDALRSTSPDGLRREFLMRPGILSLAGDGDWLLRVEHRTVDILLDQLPWGVSIVALPWMHRLMRIEWH